MKGWFWRYNLSTLWYPESYVSHHNVQILVTKKGSYTFYKGEFVLFVIQSKNNCKIWIKTFFRCKPTHFNFCLTNKQQLLTISNCCCFYLPPSFLFLAPYLNLQFSMKYIIVIQLCSIIYYYYVWMHNYSLYNYEIKEKILKYRATHHVPHSWNHKRKK